MEKINLLKNLGFTEYEARVYIALSELGPSKAREIAEYSKVPRNKTYEILKDLEKKNKIQILPITPKKYKILNMDQLKKEVDDKKEKLHEVGKKLDKFIEESRKPRLSEFKEVFWIIRGKRAIIEKMKSHNKKCEKEILSINRLSKLNPANIRDMKKAIDRGTKVKMLVPNKNDNKNVVSWENIGVEIKDYNESKHGPIGTRISIFDKNTVRITFGEPDVNREEDYITLWAESPYLANILRNYFFNIWNDN